MMEAAVRFVRMPRGHPEALTDAWANLYIEMAVAIDARRNGATLPDGLLAYPIALDGAKGVKFVEGAVESNRTGEWVDAGSPIARDDVTKPTILIADPEPRSLKMIFKPEVMERLRRLGEVVVHAEGERLPPPGLEQALSRASIVIGQIDLPAERLDRMPELKAVFNVEDNFLPNIDYARCFARGVHVLNTSPVYATSVAETALGMALDLARGITGAHEAFRSGVEKWGLASNEGCFLLTGASVGIIGLGDLGSALRRMLVPFRCPVRVYDPWLAERRIVEQDCAPSTPDELLAGSRVVFVFASSTSDNQRFIGARELALMQQGSVLLLMSRAAVVDFAALEDAVRSGRISGWRRCLSC